MSEDRRETKDNIIKIDEIRKGKAAKTTKKEEKSRITKDTLTEEQSGFSTEEREEDGQDTQVKPWTMAAAFLSLIVLAAILCAILWHFTHLDKDGGGRPQQQSPVIMGEETPEPTLERTPDATLTPEPVQTTSPKPEDTPVGGMAAGQTALPSAAASASPSPTPAAASASPSPTPAAASASPSPTPAAASVSPSPASQGEGAVGEPVSGTAVMSFSETQLQVMVTPKDVVNLRSEPSTLEADNIVAQAVNGEVLTRTGINRDTGWLRLDYNGQTVYAVAQYLTEDLDYKTPVQASSPNRVNTIDGRIILFTDCDDTVTPKEYVNLRTEPSTSEGDTTVRCQVSNGETIHRTGFSPDAGWSRVEYNGETLYVVSSYVYVPE